MSTVAPVGAAHPAPQPPDPARRQFGVDPGTGQRRVVVPAIDGFRGMAAMTVLVYHAFYFSGLPALGEGTLRAIIAAGYLGVDYFFVISGFVLFLPTVVNDGDFGSVRTYAVRRVARIVPPYYVLLALVILFHGYLSPLPTALPFSSAKGTLSLLLHLAFLQHIFGSQLGPGGFGVITVSWTLTLEVLFYLSLPLVAARYHRHPFVGLAIAVIVSLLWRLAATHVDTSLGWLGSSGWDARKVYTVQVVLVTQFPNYLAHFAAGMTSAWLFVWFRRRSTPRAALRLALPVQVLSAIVLLALMRHEGALALAHLGPYQLWTRSTPIAMVFAVLLLSTTLSVSWAQWPVTNPVSRWLGDVSYGIYLSHLIVLGFAVTTLGILPAHGSTVMRQLLLVVVPGTLVVAWLSWMLVEKPSRAWGRRHSRRPTPAAHAPVPVPPG